jgi:DNA-binding SARP family transcriptional activator/tetratricopeptide (TPR) repeat protein
MGGDAAGTRVMVGLLGPVEIGPAGGVMAPVAQPRLRVLLGLLSVVAGRVVTVDSLVDGLWGEEWSPRREKNLHSQVSALRRRLEQAEPGGGGRLARAGAGYRLVLGSDELDVVVFRDLAGRGQEAARAGDAAAARELLGQALGVWRGTALADAAQLCPRLAGEAARLEEARAAVVEERVGCDLVLGRHAEVVGELAGLVVQFPLRERLAGLLMTALYRCGRRGEALAVYDTARLVLAEELGLDPGPELARLQTQVLADDPALAAPALAPLWSAGAGVVPRQLPAGAGFFAGREVELKQLDELLDQAGLPDGANGNGAPGGTVVISAVAGMAGVGKTALAVHWAHRVAARFPDGQLYVNLRGYDPGAPVTPEEATGWFLAALGVPAAQIPADAQARCGLYRSVLAGRRVLVVLDNARDAAQVRPLLPGGGGCLVVVTSRSALAGLAAAEGARPLRLGPLDDEQAALLLAARLGLERVAAEPDAVTELADRCGRLPLALAVMAARAAADPDLPLAGLAAQLAGAPEAEAAAAGQPGEEGPRRLEVLDTGDPATSLSELLSWSHRQLSEPAAAMFALLGLHCGPDITIPAAASLAGVSRPDARRALAELTDASLTAEHRPGRHVMHDLVRGYAAAQARQTLSEADIREAIGRSLDHYLHTGLNSYDLPPPWTPAPPAPGVVPEQLAGEAGLLDSARAEHQVLLQATAQAAAAGLITRAWQLFYGQAYFLIGQGYWADLRATAQAVLAAAQAVGDHAALGWTHAAIGYYSTLAGAPDQGRGHEQQALEHFRRADDLPGQAFAHLAASLAYGWAGDLAEAVTQGEAALALYRETSDQTGQGWALAGLAECHAYLESYDLARSYGRQALQVTREDGDPTTFALAWHALGLVHSRLGEPREAISCYQHALAFARKRENSMARKWLVIVLADFGDACQANGDLPAAAGAWQQALQILDDLRLPDDMGVRARLEQVGPPPPG